MGGGPSLERRVGGLEGISSMSMSSSKTHMGTMVSKIRLFSLTFSAISLPIVVPLLGGRRRCESFVSFGM